MLAGLDPHSSYMVKTNTKPQKPPAKLRRSVSSLDDSSQLKVVSPRDAHRRRMPDEARRHHLTIDKSDIGLALAEIEQARGPAGTEVALTLRRAGINTPVDVKVKRVPRRRQPYSRLENGTIGYVRVAGFGAARNRRWPVRSGICAAGRQQTVGFVSARNNPAAFRRFRGNRRCADRQGRHTVMKGRKGDEVSASVRAR